ncbi:hypothetical protein E2320_022154, partial [Naja naja]
LGIGFEFFQGERRVYPSFFQINPKESPQFVGLVQLLIHFQWNWVGVLAPEDERGEHFLSTLTPIPQEKEICLAFILMLKLDSYEITQKKFFLHILTLAKAEVFVLFGDLTVISTLIAAAYYFENIKKESFRKVCIFTSHWKIGLKESESTLPYIKLLCGVLHFRAHSRDISKFSHFLMSLDPLNPQGDVFLPQWWEEIPTIAKRLQTICVFRDYIPLDKSYYRPGDLIIGGNLPLGDNFDSTVPHFNTSNLLLDNGSVLALSSLRREKSLSFLLRIDPKESPQYKGLIQLLLHFQWNWVGLMAPEDERGEHFISTLTPMLQEKDICLAFSERLKSHDFPNIAKKLVLNFETWSKIEVILLLETMITFLFLHEKSSNATFNNVWILTSHWKLSVEESKDTLLFLKAFHGVLHFRDHTGDVSEFSRFLLSLDPLNPQGDVFLPT